MVNRGVTVSVIVGVSVINMVNRAVTVSVIVGVSVLDIVPC